MKRIFIIVTFFVFTACEDGAPPEQTNPQQDSLELSRPVQAETNMEVNLLPEAQEAVNEWLAYATAQNEIENLRNATGRDLMENSEPLVQIMQSLHATIPPELQEAAVRARVNVLLTKAQLLHQRANKKYRSEDEIYKTATDLIQEFDNFKIQLNEVFLSSPEDFELELDREFEENLEEETEIEDEPATSPEEQ